MATNKIVTVTTIPTRSDADTVASYNIYSNIDGLLDNMSPAEAAAGHTVSLSDGSLHNVTVKTVWTTAGESTTNVSNIEVVDLTVTDPVYGVQFSPTASAVKLTGMEFTDGAVLEITVPTVGLTATNTYLAGSDNTGSLMGAFAIRLDVNDKIKLHTGDGASNNESAGFDVVDGDIVKLSRSGDDMSLYLNNVLQVTNTVVGFDTSGKVKLVIGSSKDNSTLGCNSTVSRFSFKGEEFPMEENAGTTITGENATVLNFVGTPTWVTL